MFIFYLTLRYKSSVFLSDLSLRRLFEKTSDTLKWDFKINIRTLIRMFTKISGLSEYQCSIQH